MAKSKRSRGGAPAVAGAGFALNPVLNAYVDLGERVVAGMTGGAGRKRASREVAAAEGLDPSKAKAASLFVQRYDEAAVARLARARTRSGGPIPLTILRALATVGRAGDRRRLLREVASGRCSAADFGEVVRRVKGGAGSGGGPRRTPPATLAAGLDQVRPRARGWAELRRTTWADDAPWLAVPPGADATAGRDLAEVHGLLLEVVEAAASLARRIAEVERGLRPPA